MALRTKVKGIYLLQEEDILKNRPFVDFDALRKFGGKVVALIFYRP